MRNDNFSSGYDGATSIGCDCEPSIGAVSVGAAHQKALVGALEAYFDGYEDVIGAVSFNLNAKAGGDSAFLDAAKNVSSAVNTAADAVKTGSELAKQAGVTAKTGAPDKGWQDAAAGIRAVTRSPITHAALAAVACVVPYGTVAAAVGEVGLGVAEGVAAIADELGKWCPWCGPTPEQQAAARAAEEAKAKEAEKARRAKIAAAEKAAAKIQEKKLREIEMKRVAEAKAKLEAKLAAQKKKAEEARAKKERERKIALKKIDELQTKLADKLAKCFVFAEAGDARAMRRLIAFQTESNHDLTKSKYYTKARAQGYSHASAEKIMVKMTKDQPKFWREVVSEAKAKAKKLKHDPKVKAELAKIEAAIKAKKIAKSAKPNFKGINTTLSAGAAVMLAQARMVADRRGGVRGVLVSGERSYGGHFEQSDDPMSPVGVVVLASGKPVKGRWKALAA